MSRGTTVTELDELRSEIQRFIDQRGWHRFDDPKNLAMAIAGEVGELVSELQWLTSEQARDLDAGVRRRVSEEAADVLIYLLHLAAVLGVDLVAEALAKVRRNEERFPVDGTGPG